jgi:SpoVK/Ycf46/Vps4 family AAA+-type ATPase
MEQRKGTFTPEAKEYNITPSRGALVIGPPGTGKSLVAKAAGSILNLPVVRFDVGRVFGSYIGQSEQSMRGALGMLDAMAPIVLMLDEIDKGFSGMAGGSNDSGTTSRVFGTFLTWMQERDQVNRPVFLIMTANRIDGLPPELLRKGRVDEIWSVNQPSEPEREAIISIHARKRNQEIEEADMPALVRITDGLVGAEIESLIEDALVMSFSDGDPTIDYNSLEKAKAYLKPMSVTRATEFAAMRAWAEKNARPASTPSAGYAPPLASKAISGSRRRVIRKPVASGR